MHVVRNIVSTYTVFPYIIYRKSNYLYVRNNEFQEFSNSEEETV
jgi:hypothetical protein